MNMNLSIPSEAQVLAAGRHVATFAAGATALFVAMHLMSGGDASQLQAALDHITKGAAEIVQGVSILAGLVSAFMAARSASQSHQIASVIETSKTNSAPLLAAIAPSTGEGVPGVKGIITTQEVANATPSDKVVANASNIPTPK